MKRIVVLSGDKRQHYINEYLIQQGFDSNLKNNMDFHKDDYIVCGTPFSKSGEYINCDFHSAFPIDTFLGLLKKGQCVFGGAIPNSVMNYGKEKGIRFVDVLKDFDVVWQNATLTAEGLIGEIITKTDFSLKNSNVLIFGFGKCGMNTARFLKSFDSNIIIYDHTTNNLSRAKSFGCKTVTYPNLMNILPRCDCMINTVPFSILTPEHYKKISKKCILFEIASAPYGFDSVLVKENNLSLHTCPGLPGKYTPKAAGELIAKSITSYLERTR